MCIRDSRNIEKFAVLGALILVAQEYGSEVSRLQLIEQQSYEVFTSAVTVLAGIMLWRISVSMKLVISGDSSSGSLRLKLLGFLRRIIVGVAIISPLIAAIGYVNAGSAIAVPMVKTLGFLALIVILQRLTFDLYLSLIHI